MFVPSSLMRDGVMTPALEAVAENLGQRRMIHNPSVEIDSIVEHVTELARTATPSQRPHVQAILELVRDLVASNDREGAHAKQIAGLSDSLATDLRRAESLRDHDGFSVKAIAAKLRKPLEVIVHAKRHDGTKYVQALMAVTDVLGTVPAAFLLDNVSLRHELGKSRYTALSDLVQDRDA